MATVEVDVDLEDFDTCKIIDELEYRLKNDTISNDLKKKLNKIIQAGRVTPPTLIDSMKLEYFLKIKDNYTLEQIEEKLP